MKVYSILALATLALAACSVDRAAAAAACTPEDVEKMTSITVEMAADSNCATSGTSKCGNDKCAETMKKLGSKMPDCTADGMNAKDEFAKLIKECDKSSASSITTSAGVALASTAVAVAIAYL